MPRVLGLDISTEAVRGVLIRTALRKSEVVQYIEASVADATSEEVGLKVKQRYATQAVLQAVGQAPDSIVIALEGREVSLRTVELPVAAAKKIAEVLPFEIEAQLPFPVEDAVLSEQLIERTADKLQLMVAAVPRERLRMLLAELKDSGVEPRHLTVAALALEGLSFSCPELAAEGPVVVVDLKEDETDLAILKKGKAQLARTLSGSASALRDKATQEKTAGALLRDIQMSLASYRAQGGAEPSEFFVSGASFDSQALATWLSERLGKRVDVLPLPEAINGENGNRQGFTRALALAGYTASRANALDLLQGEFAPKRTIGALRQKLPLLAACGLLVGVALGFSVYARYSVLAGEREVLRSELAKMTKELLQEETSSPARAQELLARGRHIEDPLPEYDAYNVLETITSSIPTEIKHDTRRLHIELTEDGKEGRFEIQGTVQSIGQRDQIASNLEQHECIHDLVRGQTTSGTGDQAVNYKLEGAVRCPGQGHDDSKKKGKKP